MAKKKDPRVRRLKDIGVDVKKPNLKSDSETRNVKKASTAYGTFGKPGEPVKTGKPGEPVKTGSGGGRPSSRAIPDYQQRYDEYMTQVRSVTSKGDYKPTDVSLSKDGGVTFTRRQSLAKENTPYPKTPSEIGQQVVMGTRPVYTTQQEMTAKEAREAGFFNLYRDDAPLTITIQRPKDYYKSIMVDPASVSSYPSLKGYSNKQLLFGDISRDEYELLADKTWGVKLLESPIGDSGLSYQERQSFGYDKPTWIQRLRLVWQKNIWKPFESNLPGGLEVLRGEQGAKLEKIGAVALGGGTAGLIFSTGNVYYRESGGRRIIYEVGSFGLGALQYFIKDPSQPLIDYTIFQGAGQVYGFGKGLLLPKTTALRYGTNAGQPFISGLQKGFTGGLVVGGGALIAGEVASSQNPSFTLGQISAESFVAFRGFERGVGQGMKFGEESFYASLSKGKAKNYPKLVTDLKSSNIRIVPDYTITRSRGELLGLQGKRVTATSATPDAWVRPFYQPIVGRISPTTGPFRRENVLLSMYFSSPMSVKSIPVKGFYRTTTRTIFEGSAQNWLGYGTYTTTTKTSYVKPFIRTTTKSPIYTAYIGDKAFGVTGGGTSYSIGFGRNQAQALQFTSEVSMSPYGRTLRELNIRQLERPGELFVPSENIFGLSNEGQLITPSRVEGVKGYEFTRGGLIRSKGMPRIVYYERPSGTLANYDFETGKNIIPSIGDFLFGPRYRRLEVVKADIVAAPATAERTGVSGLTDSGTGRSSGSASRSRINIGVVPGVPSASSSVSRISMISSGISSSTSSVPSSFGSSVVSSSSSLYYPSYVSSVVSSSSSGSSVSSFLSSSSSSSVSSGSSIMSSYGSSSYSRSITNPPVTFERRFKLPLMGFSEGKGKRRSSRGLGKGVYAPSVTAVVFGVKSKKIPDLYESGLVLRPIVGGI